jgi:hypothetical protein
MIRRTSKIIAIVVCIINILLAYLFRGFELGHDEGTNMYLSGGSSYGLLANYYTYISLLLLIFTVGKFIRNELLSRVLCVSLLVLAVFQYFTVYLQKSLFFGSTNSFTKLLRETIPVDLISFSLLLFLLALEIIAFFQRFKSSSRIK